MFWYTTLQTLLWLKGRYIEALKFVLVYHVTNLIMAQSTLKHLSLYTTLQTLLFKGRYTTLQTLLWLKGRYIEALNCGIPRYKPCYGSRGGTLKHLSLFWYTTLQTLLWLKGRYIEALNCFGIPRYKPYKLWLKGRYIEALNLVYHVTNLIMARGTLKHLSLIWYTTLQTLLWIKGRYIEALNYGIPRYKPCYGSRGGTLKHLSLFWYTTLQTLLWIKGRYIALKG